MIDGPRKAVAPEFDSGAKPTAALSDRVRSLRLPDERRYDTRPGRWWLWLIVFFMLTAGVAVYAVMRGRDGGSSTDAATQNGAPAASAKSAAQTVSAAPVAAVGDVALESKGYIIPAHQILVSPKVNGMIVELHIVEGKRVEKGDVLAVIESTDYEADLRRAQALLAISKQHLAELEHGNRPEEIAAARAELGEAMAQRDQLYSAFKRNSQLKGTKVLTETDYEQSESQYKAMDRRVARLQNNHKLMVDGPRIERIEVARAEVQQAEADVAKTKWRLDNCTIRAPVSGTILKKNAEEGNIVNSIAFNGSFSVCEMADLSDLEVDLSIQERDISRVHAGQRCQVRSEAFTDRVYEGVVSRLMPIADRAKGAVPVRVKLSVPADEEGVYLKPEMSAVVSFLNDHAAVDAR